MKNLVRVQAKLLWKWRHTRSGHYVAVCDAIAQTVQADKFEELLESIHEALDSTFRDLLSSGDLDNFLRERGWARPNLPLLGAHKDVRFDVPFDLQGVRVRDLDEALCK